MLRRNLASEFVAGAYVFPGGSVDPEDRGPEAEALCRGLTDAEASDILGLDSGGLAFWVAALRECFEEAGCDARPAERWRPSRRGRCSTPAAPTWPSGSPPTARRSTTGPPGCSTSARRKAWCWRRTPPLRQPLDHARAGPEAVRHPVLHHRRPARPGGPPRRRRDHRHHLGPAAGRAGPSGRRGHRAPAADHRQSPEPRGVPIDRRSDGLGPSGHRRPHRAARRPHRGRARCWCSGPATGLRGGAGRPGGVRAARRRRPAPMRPGRPGVRRRVPA